MSERLSEGPVETLESILNRLNDVIPQDIRKRYCDGFLWNEILQYKNQPLDLKTERSNSMARHLAAYLINILVQGLFGELAFEQKMADGKLMPLIEDEKKCIHMAILDIVAFVQNELAIPIDVDPEINQLHVMLRPSMHS